MRTLRDRRRLVYNTRRWRRLRELALDRSGGLCERCEKNGMTVPAAVVHHVEPVARRPELAWELGNLECLCRRCHDEAHAPDGPPGSGRWRDRLAERASGRR